MNISTALKIALIHRRKTQKSLAGELGVSVAYISALATGVKGAGGDMTEKIAKQLNYKTSEFIALGE